MTRPSKIILATEQTSRIKKAIRDEFADKKYEMQAARGYQFPNYSGTCRSCKQDSTFKYLGLKPDLLAKNPLYQCNSCHETVQEHSIINRKVLEEKV